MAAYSPGHSGIPVYGTAFSQNRAGNGVSAVSTPGIAGGAPILFAGNTGNISGLQPLQPLQPQAGGRGIPTFGGSVMPQGQIPGMQGQPGLKPVSPYPVLMTPNGPAYIMSVSPLNPGTVIPQQQEKPSKPSSTASLTCRDQSQADADYALALKLNQQLNFGGAPAPASPTSYESDEELAKRLQEEENRRAGVY